MADRPEDADGEAERTPLRSGEINVKRARGTMKRLDLTLKRIRHKKDGNWLRPLAKALFVVLIVIPLAWTLLYRFFDPPGTMLMALRATQGQRIAHRPVKIENISPYLVRAVIAAEDSRFCRHDGFDVQAIKAAMKANQRAADRGSSKLRGASTISQQTAKNVFLWPQRSWLRKGAESYFTVLIEHMWGKKRIMQAYLNAAEWGDGRFGAEAAAQAVFKKSARNLNSAEAARLAAILPSPNRWSAVRPGPYVRRRTASIEKRMRVVRDSGLDLCVLEPGAAPPPRPPKPLPPLAEAPATEAPPEDADALSPSLDLPPLPGEEPAAPEDGAAPPPPLDLSEPPAAAVTESAPEREQDQPPPNSPPPVAFTPPPNPPPELPPP